MARRSGRGSGHVYQRRDGRWEGVLQADFPDGSKRRSFYGARQADVIAKLDKAKADLHSGIMPTPERFTTAAFLRAWIEGRRGKVRDNTWRRYEGIVTRNIVPLVGNVPLVRLGSADVNRMTARLQERGLSAQTASHARSVLRLALNAAVEDGILPRNVAALRSCAVPVERPTIVATTPEHARLITAAFSGHRLDSLVSIALSTGARQGELLALRWSDVDFDVRQLRIERTLQRGVFTAPKTKRSRRSIDLSDGDVATLRSHR